MPRYFFDVEDGIVSRDQIGRVIRDEADLRSQAFDFLSKLSCKEGQSSDGFAILLSVRNEAGAVVLVLRNVCQVETPAAEALRLAS